jgi:hypothetical protein
MGNVELSYRHSSPEHELVLVLLYLYLRHILDTLFVLYSVVILDDVCRLPLDGPF